MLFMHVRVHAWYTKKQLISFNFRSKKLQFFNHKRLSQEVYRKVFERRRINESFKKKNSPKTTKFYKSKYKKYIEPIKRLFTIYLSKDTLQNHCPISMNKNTVVKYQFESL
jgi:hypothetical protein